MQNGISHKKAQELVEQLNFSALVYNKMTAHNTSPMELSIDLGQHRGYLYRQLKYNNQSAAIILALSEHLQTNLFEPYVKLLSEELQITQREKDLQAHITTLQQQIAELTKERDIYKTIAMKWAFIPKRNFPPSGFAA